MSKGKKIGIAVLLVFVVGIVLSWGKISVFLDGRTGTINNEKQRFVLDTELNIE